MEPEQFLELTNKKSNSKASGLRANLIDKQQLPNQPSLPETSWEKKPQVQCCCERLNNIKITLTSESQGLFEIQHTHNHCFVSLVSATKSFDSETHESPVSDFVDLSAAEYWHYSATRLENEICSRQNSTQEDQFNPKQSLCNEQINQNPKKLLLTRTKSAGSDVRPDKFMLKKIFTPLKRILQSEELIRLGIDLTEYFKARPNPKGGHRTPADIELLLWFVEEKYRHQPNSYSTFVEYLTKHRCEMEEYGRKSYAEKSEWEQQYIRYLNNIFEAMQIKGDSERRYRCLFSRNPSHESKANLFRLKGLFNTDMTAK